jgi:hypothetical protein
MRLKEALPPGRSALLSFLNPYRRVNDEFAFSSQKIALPVDLERSLAGLVGVTPRTSSGCGLLCRTL